MLCQFLVNMGKLVGVFVGDIVAKLKSFRRCVGFLMF